MKPNIFEQVLTPDGEGLVCAINYDSKIVEVCPKVGPQKPWRFEQIVKIGNSVSPRIYFNN